jgi:alanine racemase
VTSTVVARIRAAALLNNLQCVRRAAPGCRVLAVIKANAYGHGLVDVARILTDADAFAVARIAEGVSLRQAEIDRPIVVLSDWMSGEDLRVAREHDLQLVVHDEEQIALLEADDARSGSDGRIGIWLKLDTGMNRLGIPAESANAALSRLRALANVGVKIRLMTHLATADVPGNPATEAQLQTFAAAAGQWEGDISIANSAAILAWQDSLGQGSLVKYSGENWVRPGIMLYGVSPFADRTAAEMGLQPAMSFEARLIATRIVRRGSCVGYAGDWTAQRDSVVGVVDVGYADGFAWRLGNTANVLVEGVLAPVIGRVSMDMISVDLTDIPAAGAGSRVVLWGAEPAVAELATAAGTLPYELLTSVGQRVERLYE